MSKSVKSKQIWVKVESKSHPGEFYYFDKKSGKCSWNVPPGLEENSKTVSTCAPAGNGSQERKKTKPPQLNLQSNNNGNMESSHPTAVQKEPGDTSAAAAAAAGNKSDYDWYSGGGVTRGVPDGDVEEMDCEERWGAGGEVSMDVDLSETEQEQLLSEISQTRDTLLPATSLESFDLSASADSTAHYQEMLYFVLDTNVLISHLQFLVELKDYAIKGVGRPVLIIPWAVMQELDALKTRTNASLASKAKKAIDMLHKCFSANHPRVRGQTMEEVQTESSNIAISNNDDRILHCCRLYQQKVIGHGGVVVLFSNDIQLSSKAMLNGVRALNRKTLLNELRILCKSNAQAKPTSYTHTKEYAGRVAAAQKQTELANFIDDLICQSEAIVREGLATIVKKEMIEAFDENLWIHVVIVKPPWSLKDLVHILDKHWIAVFGLVLDRGLKRTVESLLVYTNNRSMNIGGMLELETFHRLSFDLLRAFNSKSDYGGVVPHCITQLTVLSQKGVEARCGHVPQPHPLTPTPVSPPSVSLAHTQGQTYQTHTTLLSPTKLPPTPPNTPGLMNSPFFGTYPVHIEQLVMNIPSSAPDRLQWLLSLILEMVKYCHSHLLNLIQRDKIEAVNFLSNVSHLVATIVQAMNCLLRSSLELHTLRGVIEAFDGFLLRTLVVNSDSQPITISCPLTLSEMYSVLHDSGHCCQLMRSAFVQFQHYMDIFNLLQQSL